ncbi:PF02656 domain protein [Aspergillus cavernicola]|uniref:PF02656 domain protein n=1 Tax=Aspergillus cavernicola TaxID=176166 RepID=A0ABR4I0I4_9EURO
MDQSDFTTQHTREVGASPPTQRSSPLREPTHFNSPHQATMPLGQEPPQPVNEVTPIVSHNSSPHRRYRSTENVLRNLTAGSIKSPSDPCQQNSHVDSEESQATWYSRVADRYGSLELENKGSVARDHLALERTFLAWLRTSLAFASIGIAVTQLFRLSNTTTQNAEITPQSVSSLLSPTYDASSSTVIRITDTSQRLRSLGKPLGTTFIGVAILILIVGFHRYFESQYWIIRGKFPASRGSIALIAFVAGALIIAALAVIIAISPGAVET